MIKLVFLQVKSEWIPLVFFLLIQSIFTPQSFAQESFEPSWVIDAQAAYYFPENSTEQESLLGVELFMRRTIGEGFGLYTFGYHDEEYWEAIFGISKILGNLEIGIGIGKAGYDGKRWTDINPWLFYSDGVYEASLHLEYLPEEISSEKWFFKYHLQRSFGERWFGGLYGEKNLGLGPMIGIDITKYLSAWASIPVLDQPDYGRMDCVVALSFTFE